MGLVLEGARYIADNCRSQGTRARLRNVLKEVLNDLMPDDLSDRISGNTHIGITKLLPFSRFEFVSEFKSRDDAIDALLTSCHIPLWFSGSLAAQYRGKWYYDGGVSNFIPLPPHVDQSGDQRGVRVTCFPSVALNPLGIPNIEIAPGEFNQCPYTFQQMLSWAFTPPDPENLSALERMGRGDARTWAVQIGLITSLGESLQQSVDLAVDVDLQ
eukprot:TRINITY_DN5590_c1_g1_i3.p1 TRINITY_DN5590_c1_g1~~TRINITY_DN5590_c1_g1_i3.p1  ORF type:complete len:214 (-),score=19.11 TRINITY_DN5590_c1_g1_i3:535-1176(-)